MVVVALSENGCWNTTIWKCAYENIQVTIIMTRVKRKSWDIPEVSGLSVLLYDRGWMGAGVEVDDLVVVSVEHCEEATVLTFPCQQNMN